MSESQTNITDDHKRKFNALTSGQYSNFCLMSCFCNGEPTAAICAVNQDGNEYHVIPLFIAITPSMKLEDHDGNSPE